MAKTSQRATYHKPKHDPLRPRVHEVELSNAERRVARQIRIIHRLRGLQISTERAEAKLKSYNLALMQLRNHDDLLSNLLLKPKGRVARIEGY